MTAILRKNQKRNGVDWPGTGPGGVRMVRVRVKAGEMASTGDSGCMVSGPFRSEVGRSITLGKAAYSVQGGEAESRFAESG
jgi:hypothetical protein